MTFKCLRGIPHKYHDIVLDLAENIAEIGYMVGYEKFRASQNSRDTNSAILEWADQFTSDNLDREWDGEWMDEIETFTFSKIKNNDEE